MFKWICFVWGFLFLSVGNNIYGQKVGLVLSGGGAKGIAHVGLIAALEENDIPIEYVSGTSIGAIVGSMYAMGYSPKEMLELFLSKDFYSWQTGKVDDSYYYFRKPEATPEFVRFMVPLKDSTDVLGAILPANLINPIQMNLAFMNLFAQATAVCGGNFNNLFVPFLCIVSDVYNKRPIVFRAGDLGDAVRASMTFPFVFKPIVKDSIPLYDGGLYDNFPIRPMLNTFRPDFIIGSAVAGTSRRTLKTDRSLYGQLENMIIGQKTDYMVKPEEGIFFRFAFDDVGLLDFDKAQELYDIGYRRGLEMIDSIKLRVKRTVSPEEIAKKRSEFRNNMPELVFQNVIIKGGALSEQRNFIESQLKSDGQKTFNMDDFKKAYFKLLIDTKIKEIIPHARYNRETGYFDLILDVKIDDEILAAFGGNISSANANQFYFGLEYRSLTEYSVNFNLDLQVGNAFSGVLLQGRIEPPYKFPIYFKLLGAFNYRKYYESEKLFIDDHLLTFMQQREGYLKICAGFPSKDVGKSELRIGYGSLEDKYFQNNTSFLGNFDKSVHNLFLVGASVEKNSFDTKQFPVTGKNYYILTEWITGKESYTCGSKFSPLKDNLSNDQSWLQLFGRINNYHTINKRLNFGYLLESVISNKNLLSNYTVSIMQAPAFTPTVHSKIVFNEAFRANQYLAAGITPIFKINKIVHLRGDFDVFAPIRAIKQDAYSNVKYGNLFADIAYLGETSLVVQLPFLSVSLYGNAYSFPQKNWNFGLNIGYIIFNPKFTQ